MEWKRAQVQLGWTMWEDTKGYTEKVGQDETIEGHE